MNGSIYPAAFEPLLRVLYYVILFYPAEKKSSQEW